MARLCVRSLRVNARPCAAGTTVTTVAVASRIRMHTESDARQGARRNLQTPLGLSQGFNGFCATCRDRSSSAKAVEPPAQGRGRVFSAMCVVCPSICVGHVTASVAARPRSRRQRPSQPPRGATLASIHWRSCRSSGCHRPAAPSCRRATEGQAERQKRLSS